MEKESEWEKKWNDGVRPCAWDEVADFITAIVSTREKEIAEEVEKIPNKYPDMESDDYDIGLQDMKRLVLQIIKH